jgi:PAS domain S-box-containing protein
MIQQAVGKRKSDELLIETNVYLTSLITYASNPIVTWDVDSKITRFNRAFEKLTGFSEAEVLGKDFDILFPQETRSNSLDLICRALFGERLESVEIPIQTAEGDTRIVIWNSANIYAPDGTTLVATIAQGTDITDRKKAESSLKTAYEELAATEEELRQQYEQLGDQERERRQSQERLSSILRSTPTGIAVIRDHLIVEVNDRFCEMTGYSEKELADRNINTIWADIDDYEPAGTVRHGMDGEVRTGGLETRWMMKDGSVIAVVLSLMPLNLDNPSEGVTLTVLDTTSCKMAEEALHTANKKINLLTSITRHDIRNKTTIIDLNLALIRRRIDSPDITGYLDKIKDASKAIQSQIEFSRVYQDLGSSASCWQKVSQILPANQIPATVRFNMDLKGVEVFADPMLEQVFFNLLDNSLRHGGTINEIRVSCHNSGNGLILLWDDDGAGISEDEKEKIFDRGYGQNTGLRLFLAREILAITGIGIRETGLPGKGARFELKIPKMFYRFSDTEKTEG